MSPSPEYQSTAALMASIARPTSSLSLLANIKWITDHDLLLREDFYTEDYLKQFSGAEVVETDRRELSVKDRPRYALGYDLKGLATIGPVEVGNSVMYDRLDLSLFSTYHEERLTQCELRWIQPGNLRPLSLDEIKQVFGPPERLFFTTHPPRDLIPRIPPGPRGYNTAAYKQQSLGISRSIRFSLNRAGKCDWATLDITRDPVGYQAPRAYEPPFDRMTIIPIPGGGFTIYTADEIAGEVLEALRSANPKLTVESSDQLPGSYSTHVPDKSGQRNSIVVSGSESDLHAVLLIWAENWRRNNGMRTFEDTDRVIREHEEQERLAYARFRENPPYSEVDFNFIQNHCFSGRFFLERGKRETAIAEFQEALRLWPGCAVAQVGLASAQAQQQTPPSTPDGSASPSS